MLIAESRNGVPIRLTEERWTHIIEEHGELLDCQSDVLQTVQEAVQVFEGANGEFLAARPLDSNRVLVVVYRELKTNDGFVITAFITKRLTSLAKRKLIWPPKT